MKQKESVLICDLDNTLYDWVEMWYRSFNTMLRQLAQETKIDEQTLKAQIQTVFQRHGTSEYEFVIEELPILREQYPNRELVVEQYQSVIQAYHRARAASMRLYPGVAETLKTLKKIGCRTVGYTESMAFYTIRRVKSLGLDGLLDYLYSPQNHDLPEGLTNEQKEQFSPDILRLRHTQHRHTPKGALKPNPTVLRDIMREVGAPAEQTIFVGDSLMKDIAMAQEAGITDVYAKYGTAQHREAYELLREVTHWTKADVERERIIYARGEVKPSYILENSFGELLELFDFVPYPKRIDSRGK